MTSNSIHEFLKSSTIHGLVHISTAKSKGVRAAWVAIVVACFAIAIYMITGSYNQWHESPVSTTITTHPITELKFPTVTVCPPRGSNTALNHLLETVKDINFTKEERQELLAISKEVFIEVPSKKYARQMTEFLSNEHLKSIVERQATIPKVDEQGMVIVRSFEPQGSFSSPSCDFGEMPKSYRYEIYLPENIQELVGEGELVFSFVTRGNEAVFESLIENHLINLNKNMSEAEHFCNEHNSHLASVGSYDENEQLIMVANGKDQVWLGGRRKAEKNDWYWLHGGEWSYHNWGWYQPVDAKGYDCVYMSADGTWGTDECNNTMNFICHDHPIKITGNHTLTLKGAVLRSQAFYFWWNQSIVVKSEHIPRFEMNWRIENGNLPDVMELVSKDLEGSVSTPRLGSLPPPNYYKERHEYTIVIELPPNITGIIGNGTLVIDVDIVPDDKIESQVKISTGETRLEWSKPANWSTAEEICVAKGGHLASMNSAALWHKINIFNSKEYLLNSPVWLGGSDEALEGEWIWTDGSRWSEEYWVPYRPHSGSDKDCLAIENGRWYSSPCHKKKYSICSIPNVESLKPDTDTQLAFTFENISMPAIQVRWVAKPIRPTQESYEPKNNLTAAKIVGGFTVKWQLDSVNSTIHNRNEKNVWKIKNDHTSKEKDMNMMTIMNLIRESRIMEIDESKIWETSLKHKWEVEALQTKDCLNENQVAEVIFKIGEELNLTYDWNEWIPEEEDLRLAVELYAALHNCSDKLKEAAKLSEFYESLLTNENLNTVMTATMHNIPPRAGDNIKDFTTINMWYQRLDERYNFSLGSKILPLMTTKILTQTVALDPPFLRKYEGINDSLQNDISANVGTLSNRGEIFHYQHYILI